MKKIVQTNLFKKDYKRLKKRHILEEKFITTLQYLVSIGKFKHAKLSIATLQAEWIHTGILKYVDIIVPSIVNALDFFLDTSTFQATMRK